MVEFKAGFMMNPIESRKMFEEQTHKMMGFEEKRKVENIAVNRISLRKENKFITKEETLKPLIKSMEENGLLEPILVCAIDNYLVANKCITAVTFSDVKKGIEDGRKYQLLMIDYLKEKGLKESETVPEEILDPEVNGLKKESLIKSLEPLVTKKTVEDLQTSLAILNEYEEMYDDGFRYFIIAGHRRFKAYLSILLGETVVTDSDWKRVYDEKLKDAESELKDNKWFKIPAYSLTSADASSTAETAMYSDSNTTQRELTSFEVIVNTIDEMKKNGEWERVCSETVKEVIAGLSNKGVYNLVQKLKKNEEYKALLDEAGKDDEKVRTILETLPVELVPKTETVLNNKIAEYISKSKKREINALTVKTSRRIYDELDSKFMQLIFDGVITIKQAKILTTIVKQCEESQKEELYEEIKKGNFDFSKNDPRGSKMEKAKKSVKVKEVLPLVKSSQNLISKDKSELSPEDVEMIRTVISQLTEYIG